jgi:hypothetical protein
MLASYRLLSKRQCFLQAMSTVHPLWAIFCRWGRYYMAWCLLRFIHRPAPTFQPSQGLVSRAKSKPRCKEYSWRSCGIDLHSVNCNTSRRKLMLYQWWNKGHYWRSWHLPEARDNVGAVLLFENVEGCSSISGIKFLRLGKWCEGTIGLQSRLDRGY